ncbi:nitrate reductase NapE component [Thalassobacillus pellis]|nr:nitrate reductase NapE component [Thalassobacillus pellis]
MKSKTITLFKIAAVKVITMYGYIVVVHVER